MSHQLRQAEMQPAYGFFHYLTTVCHGMFFRGTVTGLENIPMDGAFLVAANHVSFLDPFLVGCQVPRQICYFARKTLWKTRIAAWWLDMVGTIPVDRDGGQDVSGIKRVLRALKENNGLVLFPEGTRSPDGNLQAPKPGIGLIACRSQVPVIPARIFGSFEAFGRGGKLRLGTPVSVVFGTPIPPAVYDAPDAGKERYQIASARIMAEIARLELPRAQVI